PIASSTYTSLFRSTLYESVHLGSVLFDCHFGGVMLSKSDNLPLRGYRVPEPCSRRIPPVVSARIQLPPGTLSGTCIKVHFTSVSFHREGLENLTRHLHEMTLRTCTTLVRIKTRQIASNSLARQVRVLVHPDLNNGEVLSDTQLRVLKLSRPDRSDFLTNRLHDKGALLSVLTRLVDILVTPGDALNRSHRNPV